MKRAYQGIFLMLAFIMAGCSKKDNGGTPYVPAPKPLQLLSAKLDDKVALVSTQTVVSLNQNNNTSVIARLAFNNAIDKTSVSSAVFLKDESAANVPMAITYENNDSIMVVHNTSAFGYFTHYSLSLSSALKSVEGKELDAVKIIHINTKIDSTNKFPVISDDALLDTIQKRTFRYFWDFAHPVSGLARERSNGDNELVTSGGSGFGIMCIPVAINRNFITRSEGLARMQTIVSFLKNTAQTFHGAFPHWLNGSTGAVIPFSTKDNGADLVETSYLMAGLLTARQYFNTADAAETTLRNDINTLYNNVEWDWFRNGNQNVLYWHWSPNYNWEMNHRITGWNECLITYILAASSTTHSIPAGVYTQGWAGNGVGGGFVNGSNYYGYRLPLGPDKGGPLFLAQYSFLGIDPVGLNDSYANYETQTKNHTLINYSHCVDNPNNWFGYSDKAWGLTASDVATGYQASSPTNDRGFIAPTAALASLPYTPAESMKALKFFYYTIGDKIFKNYGFIDAFSINSIWFAQSFLAIDQGPIMIMLENYRSRLIWNLLTSCPEVKNGMRGLGFTAPYL
ncbi:MAG: glucoamylase family protein [Bacteroidota bacterium]